MKTFRLFVIALLLILGLASIANVVGASAPRAPQAILLDENFDYGGAGGNLNTISAGNWISYSSGINPVQYVPPSLLMLGYGSSGIGGSAAFVNTGNDISRTFTVQNSGDIYAAALVNISAAQATGDYFLHFSDSGISNFRGRVYARNNGGLQFGISSAGTAGTINYSGTFSFNTTYLVVVKYNVSPTLNSALFVLNAYSAIEPGTPLATSASALASVAMNAVVIRQGTAANAPTGRIDGIRVATTWAEAVGSVSPALVINEIMYDPSTNSGNDEWFEVKNVTGSAINPNGCIITTGVTTHTIAGAPSIPAGGYYVFAAAAGITGVTADYVYGGGAQLANTGSGDTVAITCGGNVIDSVSYQVGQGGWPASSGVSISFAIPNSSSGAYDVDNDSGSNWGDSTSTIGGGNTDLGTPGAKNDDVLGPTAITLNRFDANSGNGNLPSVLLLIALSALLLSGMLIMRRRRI